MEHLDFAKRSRIRITSKVRRVSAGGGRRRVRFHVFICASGKIARSRRWCKDCMDYMDCITVFLGFNDESKGVRGEPASGVLQRDPKTPSDPRWDPGAVKFIGLSWSKYRFMERTRSAYCRGRVCEQEMNESQDLA